MDQSTSSETDWLKFYEQPEAQRILCWTFVPQEDQEETLKILLALAEYDRTFSQAAYLLSWYLFNPEFVPNPSVWLHVQTSLKIKVRDNPRLFVAQEARRCPDFNH